MSPRNRLFPVQGVFSRVARRYDVMNDAMSAGLHRLWKDSFVRSLAPPTSCRVLDVAGGTGDVALRIAEYCDERGRGGGGGRGVEVTVVDASAEMLEHGQSKPRSSGECVCACVRSCACACACVCVFESVCCMRVARSRLF